MFFHDFQMRPPIRVSSKSHEKCSDFWSKNAPKIVKKMWKSAHYFPSDFWSLLRPFLDVFGVHFGTLVAPFWHHVGTQDGFLYQDYIEIKPNSPFWPPRVPKLTKNDPQMAPKWPPKGAQMASKWIPNGSTYPLKPNFWSIWPQDVQGCGFDCSKGVQNIPARRQDAFGCLKLIPNGSQ